MSRKEIAKELVRIARQIAAKESDINEVRKTLERKYPIKKDPGVLRVRRAQMEDVYETLIEKLNMRETLSGGTRTLWWDVYEGHNIAVMYAAGVGGFPDIAIYAKSKKDWEAAKDLLREEGLIR